MDMKHNALDQIALTLTRHFDSLYYVDIETGIIPNIHPDRCSGLRVSRKAVLIFSLTLSRTHQSAFIPMIWLWSSVCMTRQ